MQKQNSRYNNHSKYFFYPQSFFQSIYIYLPTLFGYPHLVLLKCGETAGRPVAGEGKGGTLSAFGSFHSQGVPPSLLDGLFMFISWKIRKSKDDYWGPAMTQEASIYHLG